MPKAVCALVGIFLYLTHAESVFSAPEGLPELRLASFVQLPSRVEKYRFPHLLGYYWRDYHGKVPEDGFAAGTDINNNNIYIGQVFITTDKHQAILPTSIQEGKDIHVPFYGAQKANSFVQILCSENKDFYEWIPTDSAHIHLLPTGNKFVWGGVEGKQLVAIGRISYQGSRVVGKVLSGLIENARMFYVHNGKEMVTKTYEVLTYNDTDRFSNFFAAA